VVVEGPEREGSVLVRRGRFDVAMLEFAVG
jgi:hypothetical protein